jgi:hypothetical protein
MRKGIIFTFALSLAFLVGCKNTNNSNKESEEEYYTVTKEEYDQNCFFSSYIPRLTSLNFTVTYSETLNGNTKNYITKFDNGKVHSNVSYGEFYCDFKEGTYNADNQTWSFDGYFEDGGVMTKTFYENEEMPDDIYLPDIGYVLGYDELEYNPETNFYEQIAESKTISLYYVYSEVKVKFINGNVSYISYTHTSTINPEKVYYNVIEVTDYNKTTVNLPSMIGPA